MSRTIAHALGVVACLTLPALAGLAACAARGALVEAPEGTVPAYRQTVIVSTARAPADSPAFFSGERAMPPHFAEFVVSVPPDRPSGTVTFPGRGQPDPSRDFLLVEARRLPDIAAFRAAINAALADDPDTADEAVLFVHGFNVNFAEGVMRQAQMQHDFDRHDAAVLFSWPSAGSAFKYIQDRESALFARTALEQTIAALAASNARQFNLVAHSMGAFLLMDTFAAMSRLGYDEAIAKINAVILLSPDIEVDVFRMQAEPVLARGVPILIFASRRDEALALSAWIRGERDRLGSVRSAAELGGLPVTVYDITDLRAGDPFDHFAVADSPALLDLLRNLSRSDDFFEYAPPPGRETIGIVLGAPDAPAAD
jgi:esterase/lipase superfamily enzyme